MYKINIIGEKTNYFVENDDGIKIKSYWEDDSVPSDMKIITKDWSGIKSSIRSIYREKEVSREKEATENMDRMKEKDQEWREYRRKEQLKPLDDRASDMAWFNLVRQAMIGDRPASQETLKKVFEIQKKFFVENPYNLLCQPKLFGDLFPGDKKALAVGLGDMIVAAVMKDNEYSIHEEKYMRSYEVEKNTQHVGNVQI